MALLDWDLPPDKAVALPNIVTHGDSVGAELDKMSPAMIAGLSVNATVYFDTSKK